MLNARSFIIALLAAAGVAGLSVGINETAASDVAPFAKDQSRVGQVTMLNDAPGAMAGPRVDVARSGKSDALVFSGSCEDHAWPYLPAACLVSLDGKPRAATRSVTIEHRTATGSALERMPVSEVASQ